LPASDYIQLIDARKGIPDDLPDRLVITIKGSRRQPIWMPGPNFPDEPFDMFQLGAGAKFP
jgi:hypothetical protein